MHQMMIISNWLLAKSLSHLNNGGDGFIHSKQIHHDKVVEIDNGKNVNVNVSNGSIIPHQT